MRVDVVEYNFSAVKNIEHRMESFIEVSEFINRVKYLSSKYYNSNLTTYSGDVNKISIDKVLNPL